MEPTDIVQQRLNRKKLADQKWKKAGKIFWIIQIIPFMKMVLVSGSLAFGNSKDESDIDVIITAKKGRIWIVRTLATLLTSILGVRRHNKITKNKICLNHYITDQSLKIPFESLYNAQSYVHLINVYHSKNDRKLFSKFQKENEWIKKYVENYEVSELENFRGIKRNKILGFISKIFEIILSGKFGNYLEKKLSEIQSGKIKNSPLYKKSGGRITVNNNQLEFHPNSREAKISPEFNKRMEKLGLFEFAKQKDSGLRHS
jgi:predicted nucleotidyltransferase